MKTDVRLFLKTLKGRFDGGDEVYLSGSCYQLYTILKTIFKDAECYFSLIESHVITKIDGRFYDINGKYPDPSSYQKLETLKNYTHQTMSEAVFSIYGLNVVDSKNINKWNQGNTSSLIK